MSGISQDVVCAVLSVGEVHINDPLLKEGRKEMFYLMMHSTYLQLYSVKHMVNKWQE